MKEINKLLRNIAFQFTGKISNGWSQYIKKLQLAIIKYDLNNAY